MGGIGSGNYMRYRTKATLNDYRSLDINQLVTAEVIKVGVNQGGGWCWKDKESGKSLATVSYYSSTIPLDKAYIQLTYNIIKSGQAVDYKIDLSVSYPHYGGVRFWFICPLSKKRVSKLYLIPHDGRFLSRHCTKSHYDCQVRGKLDVAQAKREKIIFKLGGWQRYPVRPKGMHSKTYLKILTDLQKQETIFERLFLEKSYTLLNGFIK